MATQRILCLTISAAIFAASPALAAAPSEPARPRIARVVLVGAHWCAPCRAELPELGALAAAAAPARVALGWTDRQPPVPAPLAGMIELVPISAARTLASRHGAAARGVPFALAYSADGALCTLWRGPLRPADWAKLESQCRAG